MKRLVVLLLFAFALHTYSDSKMPRIKIETSKGTIIAELDSSRAPITVANFLSYVKEGFYNGTVFHRVIKGFMIQGGGLDKNLKEKPTKIPIRNEANNGLKNLRGTLAMARTMEPHSATAQFFINCVDNSFLDYKEPTIKGWGYCVFGKVIQGMDVVDSIENVPTTTIGRWQDTPQTPVLIKSISLIEKPIPKKKR